MKQPIIALILLALASIPAPGKNKIPERARWMQKGIYGIMYQLTAEKTGVTNAAEWNEVVNEFDVVTFARQAEVAGAAWVIFPIGGDSGYWCAPSTVMDKLLPDRPSRCSKRDLPLELENALHRKGIKLILSMPSRAPQNDPVGMKALGDTEPFSPAPDLFKIYWETAIREWSHRYGTRLAGWWFDQVYNWDGWEDETLAQNFSTWADAAREGYPNRLLAFNSKKVAHFARLGKRKPDPLDFTTGDMMDGFLTPPPKTDREVPPGALGHKRIPLSGQWGGPGYPVQPAFNIAEWIQRLAQRGRVLTIDVGVFGLGGRYGLLPPWQLECLNRVRKQVYEGVIVPEVPGRMDDLATIARYFSSSISPKSPGDTAPLLLTTGATGTGDAFITTREDNPFIVLSLAAPATLRRLEIYQSPASHWAETALGVWMWKSPAAPMSPAAAAVPENWVRIWQAEKMAWQWILTMGDGITLQHLKIGLEQADVALRLGRVKLYGDLSTRAAQTLPEEWRARQEAEQEQEQQQEQAE